jgi:CBS domain-containing protein
MHFPDPQALLNATIFFDIKAIFGNANLADSLRRSALQMTPDCSMLLYSMAQNALSVDIPIGFFRELVTDRGKGGNRSLDLKRWVSVSLSMLPASWRWPSAPMPTGP